MTSVPINIYTERTANKPAKVRVFVGPEDGSADSFTESFDLIPLEVFRFAGARPDYAVFEWRTSEVVENVEATATVTGDTSEISFNRQVYLKLEDAWHPQFSSRVLFWGELLTETLQIDPASQRITIAARVADYHYGAVLEGEYQWDIGTNTPKLVPVDPVFNPLIDGKVEGNRAHGQNFTMGYFYDLWIDPESVRTEKARLTLGEAFDFQGPAGAGSQIEGIEWTLDEAAAALCNWLGTDDPENEEPEFIFFSGFLGDIWDDAPAIKNVRLKRGKHLPHYLDQLLRPNGYEWFLDHSSFDADSGNKPTITPFRRGQGIKRWLKLQAVGEDLDIAKSNTTHITVQTDVGNLANEMRGWGSFEQKELTIELFRGWPEDEDGLAAEDLRRSDPESHYNSSDDPKRDAWRLWVANEAGDYTGLRETTQPIDSHLDLTGVFELAIPRRREVDHCLTKDANGKRRIPYLQWSDDGGATWQEVKPGTWLVLRDQIGVRFTTDVPPTEMVDAGGDCRLRITCTITGDQRIRSTSSPILDESPNLRTVPLFVDLSDVYHKRSVQTTGDLASVLAGDPKGADERDDQTELQNYLVDTLEAELSAEMKCDFRLHGIQVSYDISDLIVFVDGRDIFLNRNKYDSQLQNAKKYVQVYGVRWLFQEQETHLIVEDVDVKDLES